VLILVLEGPYPCNPVLDKCLFAGLTICVGGCHNMPRPCDLDLWPFDLENGVRITCDVGKLPPHQLRGSGTALWAPPSGFGSCPDHSKVLHYCQHSGWALLTLLLIFITKKNEKFLYNSIFESITVHLMMLYDVFCTSD